MLTLRIVVLCWLAPAVLVLGCGSASNTATRGSVDSVGDVDGVGSVDGVGDVDGVEDVAGAGHDDAAAEVDAQADAQTDAVVQADADLPADVQADAGPDAKPPTVRASAAYEVVTKTDIVYGKALVDAQWGAVPGKEIDLELDSYAPKDPPPGLLPAVVLIHGGGFTGGTRKNAGIVDQAKVLAAHGWYVVSISYRLAATQGPIPKKWQSVAKASGNVDQVSAMYLAGRDAKAAVRWLHAAAPTLGVDPNHIAIGGGSAGAYTAIGVGLSKPAEFRDELTLDQDPTLASTHLDAASHVRAVIDYWGGGSMLDVLQIQTGSVAFDPSDPPIAIIHGTNDKTVSFDEAVKLKQHYDDTGVPYIYHPLQGAGHSAWTAKIDGKSLVATAIDFLVAQQGLSVQP